MRWSKLVVIATLLIVRNAAAGCPNVCELQAGQPTLEPESDCLELEAAAQSCDCGVLLTLSNHCAEAVEPVGFVFDKCWTSQSDVDTYVFDCDLLEPNQGAQVEFGLHETGATTVMREVRIGETPHTVSVSADVSSFGGGCAVASTPKPASSWPIVAAVLVVLSVGWRRRR